MSPAGHTAIAYLVSQSPRLKGKRLKINEILFILLAGNVFDLDYFVPSLFGFPRGTHHLFPIHTPLGGIFIFGILYLLFKKRFSKRIFSLAGIAMALHLVADDFGHWLCLLGVENFVSPQIFWLYPFDPRRDGEIARILATHNINQYSNYNILKKYFFSTPKLFFTEMAVTISAIIVFTLTKKHQPSCSSASEKK